VRRRTVAVLTLAGALAAAAPTLARPHFPGPYKPPLVQRVGGRAAVTPTVAVASGGDAYLAWNTETGVALCRIAPHRSRCRPRAVIRDGVDAFREPPLLSVRAHGVVRLVSSNASGSPVLFESTDGGRRFERIGPLGQGQYFGGAFGPGARLLLTDDENGLATLVADRAGRSASRAEFAIHDQGVLGNSSAAAWTGRTPVIAGAIVGRALAWHWSGHGSPADPRDWRRETLGRAAHIAMASGPRGLFLLQDGANPDGPDLLRLWRWRHGRFARDGHLPRAASATATNAIALAQDADGALVAAWDATPLGQIDVAVSVDGGRHWSSERTITGDVTPVFRLTVALGAGGRGILAYDSVQGRVWMARISVAGLRRAVGSAVRRASPAS
jgi:hypothetical protein